MYHFINWKPGSTWTFFVTERESCRGNVTAVQTCRSFQVDVCIAVDRQMEATTGAAHCPMGLQWKQVCTSVRACVHVCKKGGCIMKVTTSHWVESFLW